MANNKSFTLIEVVVAMFLLTVGTVGTFSLMQKSIIFTSISSSRLVASYLAQEGIEIIRNIRDTNYLEGSAWDDGIVSSNWAVVSFLDGSQSKFQRQITIAQPESNKMIVSVTVSWQERGGVHQVFAQTELYNWR